MSNSSTLILNEAIEFLSEEENNSDMPVAPTENIPQNEISLDSQIDKHLLEYEQSSKETRDDEFGGVNAFESFSSMEGLVSSYLFEADEDDEEEEGEKEEEKKDDESQESAQQKLSLEDIDLLSFAGDVVRLIENFDKLIEIRDTVIRRSENFLAKNYDSNVINSYRDVLNEEYGIVPGKTRYDQEYDVEAPKAADTGPFGV